MLPQDYEDIPDSIISPNMYDTRQQLQSRKKQSSFSPRITIFEPQKQIKTPGPITILRQQSQKQISINKTDRFQKFKSLKQLDQIFSPSPQDFNYSDFKQQNVIKKQNTMIKSVSVALVQQLKPKK